DHSAASGAPRLSKKEARIDWHVPAVKIFNKIRAFKPYPGTYSLFEGKRLGIEWAEPHSSGAAGVAGSIISIEKEYFEVCCAPGTLRIMEVKPEGRRVMKVHDFLLGNRIRKGALLA
ncbi:MAG: hypothetical protein JXA71_02060, partial [Chitinispirillaceae bacterium]|nr:hypothetical protein [Chitinispirillaceae bacterium]